MSNDNQLSDSERRIASSVAETIRRLYSDLALTSFRIDKLCDEHGWELESYLHLKNTLIAMSLDLIRIENALKEDGDEK